MSRYTSLEIGMTIAFIWYKSDGYSLVDCYLLLSEHTVILFMAVYCFSSVTLPWLSFVLRDSFIIAFLLFWLKTATLIYFLRTIKSALLKCSIRLKWDTDLKRARFFCVADRYSSKITEQILATFLVSAMSPALPLSFGQGAIVSWIKSS